ncbi:ATP-binding protein [Streptomyces sp. NPDC051567]|uniref:ATP-binding protein n=1 Tax=Streptomyces sp. NPDC051567 TaxID=3365660 RepID=UPI0037A913AF
MNTQIGETARHFEIQLAATPRGARQARLLTVEKLGVWGVPPEAPAMIVAELAANAVTHGRVPGRDFRLALTLGGAMIRVAVVDPRGDRIPRIREADGAADADGPDGGAGATEGGRGLVLVDEIADRWGVEQGPPPCKEVWAELDLPGWWREPTPGP